jgi:hypothetical protein
LLILFKFIRKKIRRHIMPITPKGLNVYGVTKLVLGCVV